MKINSLTLNNFSSFEGVNFFDFTNKDSSKNIVLIGGKNGAGKTSLFTAIKIALYGPLAYGYIGINPYYISKIKECINSKAFQKETVESSVSIELSFMIEREIKEYKITRKWDYTNQKLNEEFWIENEGIKLDKDKENYFINYMQSIIPPDLFDFFLFDGEEVGNIFSTSTYTTYIKNAMYTLCGIDIFEILRKNTRNYVSKSANNDDTNDRIALENIKKLLEVEKIQKEEIEVNQEENKKRLADIEIELVELENAYKIAGGLTLKEKRRLEQEYSLADKKKSECAAKIRLFIEELMPFYITKGFSKDITSQLELEEKGEIFYYVQNKLDRKKIETILADKNIPIATVDSLCDVIVDSFRPKGLTDEFEPMHDLSREGEGKVNAIISKLENFDKNDMIQTVKMRIASLEKTMEINRILKESMSDSDSTQYIENEKNLIREREKLNIDLLENEKKLLEKESTITRYEQEYNRLFKIIKEKSQNKHIYDLSNGISSIMDIVINKKVVLLRDLLEELIVKKLNCIYRKNNLITHVEITDDFQFGLYQVERYTYADIVYLIKNIGVKEFGKLIGRAGEKKLLKISNEENLSQALNFFEKQSDKSVIDLYKKIELGRLSKGERQIFILSLYWAIIEISGKDIPFVIDTPYARIDANHRKEISQKFFPNISNQVIILSTDEEINKEYYSIIRPYIAKEYLLINDESQNKTSVENRYFFEVKK